MEPIGIQTVPLRTPTLPPATHTNTYIVGEEHLSIFDPASPFDEERARLLTELDQRSGESVERIVLTHHHHDHILGAMALKESLRKRGQIVPIWAHSVTAKLIQGIVDVDVFWEDGQTVNCGGISMTATHTPGHAPGHLVFQSNEDHAMIAGDMVAGIGTILIEPKDGHLGQYLDSLQKMRTLNPSQLLPAHGPPLKQPDQVLSMYIAHRHLRTDQIREGLDLRGRQHPKQLVDWVYPDLDKRVHGIAAIQIHSHLIWMTENGLAQQHPDGTWSPTSP